MQNGGALTWRDQLDDKGTSHEEADRAQVKELLNHCDRVLRPIYCWYCVSMFFMKILDSR